MTTKTIRIAGVQMEPKLGAVAHNLDVILERLAIAAEDNARLIVFPECTALTGYGFESRGGSLIARRSTSTALVARIATACRELSVWTIYGFLESDGPKVYNACASSARKAQSRPIGRFTCRSWASTGSSIRATVRSRCMRRPESRSVCTFAMMARFQSPRVLTLLGAELLVLPTNWPVHAECAAEHMIATRAFENVVYALAVNRVGVERGCHFIGRSSIAGTTGQILAFASHDAEEILYADIEPAKARQKHLIRIPGVQEVDRIADRRPALYGPIERFRTGGIDVSKNHGRAPSQAERNGAHPV